MGDHFLNNEVMKKNILIKALLCLFGFYLIPAQAAFIAPFQTDGCSAYPDGIPGVDSLKWYHCCLAHDLSYWMGGAKKHKMKADSELNQCVRKVSSRWHGNVMEMGVSIGGLPNTIFGWRWGYGFEKSRSYKDLSKIEAQDALIKLDELIYHLQDMRDNLTQHQRGYVVARFSYIRRWLQDEAEINPWSKAEDFKEKEEMIYQNLLDLSMP